MTGNGKRACGVAIAFSILALSGCVTAGDKSEKAKESAEAKTAPATPEEQLAAALNAKAETDARKQGGYRDPLVRNVGANGQQSMVQPQAGIPSGTAASPPLPGSPASQPAGIGGLVLQPTTVDANRTSIYSTPVAAYAATPGATAPAINAGIRSVYSAPLTPTAASVTQPSGVAMPADQSSMNAAQQAAPPPATTAAATPMKPTADATPSKIFPLPGSKGKHLDSQEALMVARRLASKGQSASPDMGLPRAMGNDIQLTPGMAASLKQPIAYAADTLPVAMNALYGNRDGQTGMRPPIQFASLPSLGSGAAGGIQLQTSGVQIGCFKADLVNKLRGVEAHFGRPVIVTSGYRDPSHNHEIGGSAESLHTSCDAADIQVQGVSKGELAAYLRSRPDRGGVGTYCRTESVHVDTGAPRDWNWGCDRV